MTTSKKPKLWKLTIDRAVKPAQIEEAIRRTEAGRTGKTLDVHGVLLERIDYSPEETVVYFSGDKSLTQPLGEALKRFAAKAKIRCLAADAKGLYSFKKTAGTKLSK